MSELSIIINPRGAIAGARRVVGALGTITSKAKSLVTTALNPLNLAIGAVGGTLAVRKLATTADAYTSIAAQLEYVTGSAAEAAGAQEELFEMSQKTGTSMTANSQALVRLSQAQDQTGLSTSRAIDVIGGLNALMLKTGTSGDAARSSMTQLTQALASGVLQGDEFKSIMENAPALMKAFAESMGVGVGELKKMASEGEITTDVMVRALTGIADEAESTFNELPATSERGWQMVVNSFERAWDIINDDNGIMAWVYQALVDLSSWIVEMTPTFSLWIEQLVAKLIEAWPDIKAFFSNVTDWFIRMFNLVYDNWDAITGFFGDMVDSGIWMYNTLKPVFIWLIDAYEKLAKLAIDFNPMAGLTRAGEAVTGDVGIGYFLGGSGKTDASDAFVDSGSGSSVTGRDRSFGTPMTEEEWGAGGTTINNTFNQQLSRGDMVAITTEQERVASR